MEIGNAANARMKQEIINIKKHPTTVEDVAKVKAEAKDTDKIILSQQAKGKLEELKKQQSEMDIVAQNMKKMLKQTKENGKAQSESMEVARKCRIISGRIINGDEVSGKDERYLAKKDATLFAQSIMLRRQNDDPKKHKSITENEKKATDGQPTEADIAATVAIGEPASSEAVSASSGSAVGGESAAVQ